MSSVGAMPPSPRPGRPPLRHRQSRLVQATPLMRWLARLDEPGPAPTSTHSLTPSFAEQLSPWLGWADAIALSSVLQNGPPGPAGAASTTAPAGAVTEAAAAALGRAHRAAEAARQVQAELLQAIRHGEPPALRSHGRQQGWMEERIAAARERLRSALAACTPALRQLAVLDEALERALAARERQLLATLPGLFRQQRAQADTAQGELAAAGEAAARVATASGQAAEADALRELLLAELHTRWAPVAGLLEALDETLAAQPGAPA